VFARLCPPGRRLLPATGLAYVHAAVVNGCRSVQRRRTLTRRLEGARDALRRDAHESAEYTAILAEDRREVLAALGALPHRRREMLVLRFYLNLPVSGGRLLLRQSAVFPYIAQALISPDGSTITALVLKGATIDSKQISGTYPEDMLVVQISAATGRQLSVLYCRRLGDTGEINGAPDPFALSNDAIGRNLMLNVGLCSGNCTDGFNGWIRGGRLIPLQPTDGRLASEAW
jgi:hypothetical protein